MEWWKLASALIAGVVIGFVSSYPVGFLRELGRAKAVQVTATRKERSEEKAANLIRAAAAEEAAARSAREEAELAALEVERVGTKFIRRVTRDDVGLLLEVVALDPGAPRERVLVTQEPPDGRVPTPHDPVGGRSSMAWRQLTEPRAEQLHRTARVIERSHDDADGWVEFERVPLS